MSVCFLLSAVVTVAWIVTISHVGASQQFLEKMNRFSFEIENARRFEKDYLLYETNIGDAISNVDNATLILHDNLDHVVDLVGSREYTRIDRNLEAYAQALERLAGNPTEDDPAGDGGSQVSAGRLVRRKGVQAMQDANTLADHERIRMNTMVYTSKVVASVGLVIVLLLIALIAGNLSRQILSPLGRFMVYTQRIAEGDYSPIRPVRKFRDEFSGLALALNRMMDQIKEHEQQLSRSSRMAAVGTLTAGIAHELNNPLNNIGVTVEVILDDHDECICEDVTRMLGEVATQVDRASGTVRNLLDFTRVERPVFAPVPLVEIIDEATRLVAHEAKIEDVKIVVEVPRELPPIYCNRQDIRQVFLNLFINAIQAMPGGGALIIKGRRHGEDEILVEVTDTGTGIAEEDISSIFDPFFTTKEVGKGNGLGLSVSYGLIDKHRGRIEVRSELGHGTTFILYLAQSPPRPADHAIDEKG